MIEILQFIFQDFWHWLGSFIMLGLIAKVVAIPFLALCRNEKIIESQEKK